MLRPHSRYKLICLLSAVGPLKKVYAKINLNQDYYYFVSDTDFAMVPMPEAEHVIDPELREKIMSGEQRTVHAQWANNRPGAGASKNKKNDQNGKNVGKLRNGVEAHSTDPNAQQPREIPEGFVRPPPGIRKLTNEEWEEKKKKLRKMAEEEKSRLEQNLDYETSDYNFGDEDWEARNCPNTTEENAEDLDDIIAENFESDFEKAFQEMESLRYWNSQERTLPVSGGSVACTGDEYDDVSDVEKHFKNEKIDRVHVVKLVQTIWNRYGFGLTWVQMTASYKNGAFHFPTSILAREASYYFNNFALHYGISQGLKCFNERIKLAEELVKCSIDELFVLTVHEMIRSALSDESLKLFVSRCGVYLLQTVELQLKEMVKNLGLATTDELIRKHIISDIERASTIHTTVKGSSNKDENDSMYEVFYFFLPRLTQMLEYMVKDKL